MKKDSIWVKAEEILLFLTKPISFRKKKDPSLSTEDLIKYRVEKIEGIKGNWNILIPRNRKTD